MGRRGSSEEEEDERMEGPRASEVRDEFDVEHEDDLALQQALALSMGASLETKSPSANEEMKGKPSLKSPRTGAKSSQRVSNKRRNELKFNKSEIDAFFVSIVGSTTGKMSLRHLENAATAQDFTWTEEQLKDMIDVFDKDNDGQLDLAEFQTMTERCKLVSSANT